MKKRYNIDKELAKMGKISTWVIDQYLDDILYGGTVQETIDKLQEYNTEDYRIESEYYCPQDYYDNHSYFKLALKKFTLESDKDFEKRKIDAKLRMERHNLEIEQKEKNDIAEYERLKKKFEKKT